VGVATGGVIFLNGTSRAGKTTLAYTLQNQFAADGECWIVIGIDDYLGRLPPDWHRIGDHVGPNAADGFVFDLAVAGGLRIGPVGRRLLAAYRGAVRSAAVAGINVIVDDVVVDDDVRQGWADELGELDVLWVRVDADDAVKHAREVERGDRLPGLARAQGDRVHEGMRYDLTVDTGTADCRGVAAHVRRAWSSADDGRPDSRRHRDGSAPEAR
jgi:chloramphenicol 3-O phosphotransferase